MYEYAPKRRSPHMTSKQIATLRALRKRNKDGTLLDVYQLMKVIQPNGTRGSMICTLRHLSMHGLIREDSKVLRKDRMRRVYAITDAGIAAIRPGNVLSQPT
jgi:hypothetical protein